VERTNEHGAKRKDFVKEEVSSEKKVIWIESMGNGEL
jgi:hypothetical protein